ncbi:MAG: cytochrome c biogenesis protein DipZ [Patescibacteria group bacterium]|nr:cytochrome c biogenesis protein DipZ [Patescibacteria group bacterium]
MALFFIAFLAGVLTVLSPCVLPLLPVIVGGSLAGGRSVRRALTVTTSLGISVFAFTFLLKVSTLFIMVPEEAWNWLSGGILFVVGMVFLFPRLWDFVPGAAQANRDSSKLASSGFRRQSFWGDVIVGAALGPVFSTCSPTYFIVLASVLPVSLAAGIADIIAYILGLCIFLFIIAVAGQRLLEALNVAANPDGWLRRGLGVLFIVLAALIVTGTLAKVEAPLYNIFDETKIEEHLLPGKSAAAAAAPATPATGAATTTAPTMSADSAANFLSPAQKALRYEKAPELVSPDAYLNTGDKPITLASLRGKVVLVDFWTYSCINCERTLPYLTAWYQKYKDQGFVIIGVHTPEFAFEHVKSNVAAALQQFDITYPVVLDNEYQTWNAYRNEYWPHEYLIDMDGYIVHDHIGEGGYTETEQAIQAALAERAARMKTGAAVATSTVAIAPPDLSEIQSPETYFGAARNVYLANGMEGQSGSQTLTIPDTTSGNALYLGGTWNFTEQYASAGMGATVSYTYHAKDVYFVASGAFSGTRIEVMQDGKLLGSAAGSDVVNGVLIVTGSRLYHVIANPSGGTHTLELHVRSPGLEAYTFTFG